MRKPGFKHTEETLLKMKQAKLGRAKSPAQKAAISAGMKNSKTVAARRIQSTVTIGPEGSLVFAAPSPMQDYRDFLGHAICIFRAVRRSAQTWRKEISSEQEFVKWVESDLRYEGLFWDWKASSFNNDSCPVVSRISLKRGFTVSNLAWKTKLETGISSLEEKAQADRERAEFQERQRKSNRATPYQLQAALAAIQALNRLREAQGLLAVTL